MYAKCYKTNHFPHSKPGNVTVNNAHIVETEVFVYNLGTMFYIDEILYADILLNYVRKPSTSTTTTVAAPKPSPPSSNNIYSTVADVERVPSEITESTGGEDSRDFLLHDDEDEDDGEIVTPRALPLLFIDSPKK